MEQRIAMIIAHTESGNSRLLPKYYDFRTHSHILDYMRVLSLNIWQGKLLTPLINFLKHEALQVDVFCFQEMVSSLNPADDIFSIIAKELPDYHGFFEPIQDNDNGLEEGLALFIRKTYSINKEGDFFVYRTRNAMVGDDWRTLGRNFQFIQFPKNGRDYTLVNFHGLADGKGRDDSDERISQSHKLKEFLTTVRGTKIVCGDFNLTLNTKSLAIIDDGMKNLIRTYGVTSTRNHHFQYPDKYCDYILTDSEIKVKEFTVLPDEVSDHLALLLEWEE